MTANPRTTSNADGSLVITLPFPRATATAIRNEARRRDKSPHALLGEYLQPMLVKLLNQEAEG